MQFIKSWLIDLFHFHKWKTLKEATLTDYCDIRRKTMSVGIRYTLQCTHCGKLKRKDLC